MCVYNRGDSVWFLIFMSVSTLFCGCLDLENETAIEQCVCVSLCLLPCVTYGFVSILPPEEWLRESGKRGLSV